MSDEFAPIQNPEEAEANIREFLDEHGLEGFLTVYFRQFLFRFVKQELQSPDDDTDDLSVQMHFDAEGDGALQEKRDQIQSECERWARELVENLKEDEIVGEVIANDDFERLWDEGVEERWQQQLHEIIEGWKDESELDDAQPDSQTTLSQDDMEST